MRVLTIIGIVLLGLIPLLLIYSAGSGPPERVWLRAPGWSRAQVVGTTQHDQAAPIAVDAAGNAYLFLVQGSVTQRRPQIVALDQQARQRWERTLEDTYGGLRDPHLLWDGRELILFWIGDGRLYTVRYDAAGTPTAAPVAISGALDVAGYGVANASGGPVIWVAGGPATPGLYLAGGGSPGAAPIQIAPTGERPQLRADAAGALHAIWLERTSARRADLMYAALSAGGTPEGASLQLAEVENLGSGADVSGPWFGIAAEYGYVGWHTRITSGMSAGQTFAMHTAFPLDRPQAVAPVEPLLIPERSDLTYSMASMALNSGNRFPLSGAPAGVLTPPTDLFANPHPAAELAVAGTGIVGGGSGQRLPQVGVIYFAAGAPTGFQQLSLSERSAFTPALVSDAAGNLYLSWRELRSSGSAVYIAGTAPETMAGLAALSLDDWLRLASSVMFDMLAGVIFAPFVALLWIGPALALLIPYALLQRAGVPMGRLMHALGVLPALAGFWAAKLIVLGPALRTVPFTQSLPLMPPGTALTLQIVTPLLIAALALYGAWAASYRRDVRSPLVFILVYGAIDTLATMAVYGAGLFGR
jgi:hypothetical protein